MGTFWRHSVVMLHPLPVCEPDLEKMWRASGP